MKTPLAVALAALLAAGVLLGGCLGGDNEEETERPRAPAKAVQGKPNFVLVVTDDQEAGSMSAMPRTRRLLGAQGATFGEYLDSYPLCCPSRTSTWTGQYAHNHGVKGNFPDEDGGGYVNLIEPERVLPEWLRASGYRTVHVGKWASVPGEVPPPGWNRWLGIAQEASARFYDYQLLDNRGKPVPHGDGDADYHTDVMTTAAADEIARLAGRKRPFFLSVAYLTPHVGAGRNDAATRRCNPGGEPIAPVPAARHAHAFAGAKLPRPPSFDERDVSDKVGRLPNPVTRRQHAELLTSYRCRLAALQAVDEGIAQLVEALEAAGELDDTYLLFTSDNGFLLGEHRYDARKNLPYDESIRVPLLVRGPGIEPGAKVTSMAMNVDLAATIMDLAGVDQPTDLQRPQDGRSLAPLLRAGVRWPNRAILIEGRYDTSERDGGFVVESYSGVRTQRYLLIRKFAEEVDSLEAGADPAIGGGELIGGELYDRERDPFELESVIDDPAYAAIARRLGRTLDELAGCEGESCDVELSLPAPK